MERILSDFRYIENLRPRKFFAIIENYNYPYVWRLYFLDNYENFNIADYASRSYFKVTFPNDYPLKPPEFTLIQVKNSPSLIVNDLIKNFLLNSIPNQKGIVTMRDVARTLQKVIKVSKCQINNSEDEKEKTTVNNPEDEKEKTTINNPEDEKEKTTVNNVSLVELLLVVIFIILIILTINMARKN